MEEFFVRSTSLIKDFILTIILGFLYQFRICLELKMICYFFILVSCTTGFYESLLCWQTERMQK